MATYSKGSSLPIYVGLLLVILFILSLITFWYQSKISTDQSIANDVAFLKSILQKIDKDCTILGFKFQKNNAIDYLQVRSFVGSEIGSMNLKNPKNWRGPYLRDNPMIQGKFYQVVVTSQGFFIVPGDGVVLHNGKTIGKEIQLTYTADILSMTQDPQMLQFHAKPLAAQLEIAVSKSNSDIEGITPQA